MHILHCAERESTGRNKPEKHSFFAINLSQKEFCDNLNFGNLCKTGKIKNKKSQRERWPVFIIW
jgi:hypothetical protein